MKLFLDSLKNDLAYEIIEQIDNPIDIYSVYIALEMNGITEYGAHTKYGEDSLLSLAENVYKKCKAITLNMPKISSHRNRKSGPAYILLFSYLKEYLTIAFVHILEFFFLILLGFTLWSQIGFENRLSIFIAFGIFCSYVTVQIIAKEMKLNYKESAFLIGFAGVLLAILLMVFTKASQFILVFIPILYYFLLSFLWLNLSFLLQQKKILVSFGLVAFPLLLTAILQYSGIADIVSTHILSLVITNALAFLAGYFFFFTFAREHKEFKAVIRLSYQFWFGIFCLGLLVADRILFRFFSTRSMSASMASSYETGLYFSLLCLPLFLLLIKYANQVLQKRISYNEKKMLTSQIKDFNWQSSIDYLFALFFLLFYVLVFFLILEPLLKDNFIHFVFSYSYFSYCFIGLGLYNSRLQVFRTHPITKFRTVALSFLLSIATGSFFASVIDPKYTVVGLFIGSTVFFLATTIENFIQMEAFDFARYST